MRNSISWSWICHFSIGICGNNSGKNQFFSRSAHAHTDRDTHTLTHTQTNTSAGWLGRPPTLVNTKPDPDLGPRHPSLLAVFLFCPQFVLSSTLSCLHFRVCVLHWFSAYTQRCSGKRCAATKKCERTHTHTHAHKRTRSACKKLISSLHSPPFPFPSGSRVKDTQQREAIKKVCN